MNTTLLHKLAPALRQLTAYAPDSWPDPAQRAWPDAEPAAGSLPSLFRLFDRSAEVMDAADQVAAEQRGRVLIVGGDACWRAWLLAQLRQQPVPPSTRRLTREGLFTLAELAAPPLAPHDLFDPDPEAVAPDAFDLLAGDLADADLALFVAPSAQWLPEQARAFARLRAAGAPVLPVLLLPPVAADPAADRDSAQFSPGGADLSGADPGGLRRQLGVAPAVLHVAGVPGDTPGDTPGNGQPPAAPPDELRRLVERMLALRPRLAIPLAQEIPFCRQLIARRVIHTGAAMTGLVGIEPLPLLDLPLQVAVQWKVLLQLAAIYGRPGLDVRSRELMAAAGMSVTVRLVTQQLLKLVPFVGWLLSGAMSALGTLLLGYAFLRAYEEDRLVDVHRLHTNVHQQAQHSAATVRQATESATAAVQHKTVRAWRWLLGWQLWPTIMRFLRLPRRRNHTQQGG